MSAVVVENLVKVFNGVTVLRGVSFRVDRGERVGYLGPNGAGKTTTIRILLGLIKPTSGRVEVLGHDIVKDPRGVRGRLGYVRQGHSFELGLTVEQSLELYGYLWGLDRAEARRRARELLELFGLESVRKLYVSQLSLGTRRLVQVIRELLHDPEVLFLDEPTTGLDPVARRKVIDYIAEWSRRRSATVFLSTHIPQDIERLCSRIILIHRGRIRADMDVEKFREAFGGLTKVVAKLAKDPGPGFAKRVREEVGNSIRVLRVSGPRVEVFAKRRDVARVVECIAIEARRQGIELRDLRIEEPTLEDALVRAYLGEGDEAAEVG
ncbi:MAG: ABC transporter ATP-binding protein [Crenarchaeota archaeon]|nr:ABC transporter ATP-binding protein [Thermoproteota archaeon]